VNEWQYGASESFSNVRGSVDLNFLFSRNVIALDVLSSQKKSSWSKAGDIIQIIDLEFVPEFFTRLEVSDSFSYLGFAPTLLKFQILSGNNYRLRFKPVPWLTEFTIRSWQYFGT
jgi:hypothetical protein